MTVREEVEAQMRELLLELRADAALIHADARLVGDLGLDSLELASAALALEEHFGVELVDTVDETVTVAGVVDAVTARLASADAGC